MIPWPELTPERHAWTGEVVLPSWIGFQSRRGRYRARSGGPSDGSAMLLVEVPDDGRPVPTAEQQEALRFLLDHEAVVAGAVTDALLARWGELHDEWREFLDDDEIDALCPQARRADDLKAVLGLAIVHVLAAGRDGSSFVGFEIGCSGAAERGLGVLTHRERAIAFGSAETAFTAPPLPHV